MPSSSSGVTTTRTTLRELIRQRVRNEVEAYNATQPEVFRGLVQPEESEQVLNGFRLKVRRPLDHAVQFDRACRSFANNGFLVLINGVQITELDDEFELSPQCEVEFVKLVPLIGG